MTTGRAATRGRRGLGGGAPGRSAPQGGGPGRAIRFVRRWLGYHLSVRWKLTLWYTVMYALILVALVAALPPLLRWQADQSIDGRLTRTAGRVITTIEQAQKTYGPTPPGTRPLCVGAAQGYCRQIDAVLQQTSTRLTAPGLFDQAVIFYPTGQVTNIPPHPIVTFAVRNLMLDLVTVAADGRPQFHTERVGQQDVRLYLAPLRLPVALQHKAFTGVLEVYQIEADYAATERALSILLLFLAPVLLGLSLLLGWWVARAALRPIGRFSRTVAAIGESKDLQRRLGYVGPRDEVGRLADTFDVMMGRLQGAFEAQKRFVADASHELRTPLTAIRGNADLMAIAPPEERAVCLAAIRKESERMTRLVNDLLLLAEADTAGQTIEPRLIDLAEIVEEVARSSRVVAGDRVEIESDVESVTVEADPDRIRQLLLNLTDNAVKFTPAGGLVTLGLVHQGDEAVLTVQDTGVGIAPDEQEAIFRRFYRADTSRSTHGTGLGLAITAWIVAAHGGTIDVRSIPGRGSTFTVRLPIAFQRSAEDAPARASEPSAGTAPAAR